VRRARNLTAGFLTLALGACALGPRVVPPANPAGSAGPFLSATRPTDLAAAPLPPRWWRLYQDPILDGLVEQALEHNTDLRIAAANLDYARAQQAEAQAVLAPATTVTAAGPAYGRSALDIFVNAPASRFYSATVAASYEVDVFGRIRRGLQAARANRDAVLAAEDLARVNVAGQTVGAYAALCGYGEQTDVARHSLSLLQETYDLTVAQRDAGALSDIDVARQGNLLAQAKGAIPPLEAQRRAAQFTLAALVGQTPSQLSAKAMACRAPLKISQPLPVGDGAALLRRRPDVREAERSLAAATARIGVAEADYFPTISLGGTAANGAATVGGLGNSSSATYTVGPGLNWTFPNVLATRARVRQAGAQASAALASFDGVVLRAFKEAESALSVYTGELDHHVALAEAQRTADEALRLAEIQFHAGAVSFLDLIVAQQTAVAADQALAQSDQAVMADQVAVFQTLGGGWEEAPAVTKVKLPGG